MPLVAVSDLTKSFGATPVLSGVSFALEPAEKVALVGCNGAGKTTLLRLVAGCEAPDRGSVTLRPGATVGYLPQLPDAEAGHTLWDEAAAAFAAVRDIERRLAEAEARLASPEVHGDAARLEAALEEYGLLRDRFERSGGFTYDAEIRRTLAGLGFREEQFRQPVASMSGGERVRGALARLLLAEPDLLLLDEPTNHLDLEALEWLQEALQRYRGAILLVSHDRALLDAVTSRTLDLDGARVEEFRGNYSYYVVERAARRERQREAFERQQAEIARLEAYIRRYRAGQKSRQAKSREKRLARLQPIGAPRTARTLSFRLDAPRRAPQTVLRARHVTKRYGTQEVLRRVTIEVRRGEKLGLIGPNGAGKTTLLRIIAGMEPPTAGVVELGPGVRVGYFAQHAEETLDLDRSVLEEVLGSRPLAPEQVRTLLGRFLFSGDAAHKEIRQLSGGERRRVALAKLVLDRPDLLLLDEPTTHLDLPSLEALEAGLRAFPGAMLLVSHDRYLLERLATRLLVLADGEVREVAGSYQVYRAGVAGAAARGESPSAREAGGRAGPAPRDAVDAGREDSPRERTGSDDPSDDLVARIGELEREQGDLGRLMGDPELYRDAERARRAVQRYEEVSARLASLYAAFEEATEGPTRDAGGASGARARRDRPGPPARR